MRICNTIRLYNVVLELVNECECCVCWQKWKGQKQRFAFIAYEMKENRLPSYWSALVALVNCVIVAQHSLRDRVRTRKEILCMLNFVQLLFIYVFIHFISTKLRLLFPCEMTYWTTHYIVKK